MKKTMLAVLATIMAAAAPATALAASYVVLSLDKTRLTMTDTRSPRLTGTRAQTFQVVILRNTTKTYYGRQADYLVIETDFDCAKGKGQVIYTAGYDKSGGFTASDSKKRALPKIAPGSKEAALQALGCKATAPPMVFSLGDARVGKVLADYRAGAYDRYIH